MLTCKNILDFRIDASTYKRIYLQEEKILEDLNSESIEDIITSIQNFGAYSLCNEINFVNEGIPFLMTQNVRDNFIDWNDVRYIDMQSHCLLHKSHCSMNQVLITMAGEYLGRAAVYDKESVCSSNQAIAKLTLKEDYSPYYVSTFINCRYGQDQINRFKTITGQPNINMGLIKYLKIPKMSDDFCKKIESVVLIAQEKISSAIEKYREAETVIFKELGVNDWQPANETISVRALKDTMKTFRIDAEYYQPKYDELLKKLNEHKCRPLGEITTFIKSIEPGSDAYQESGIPFYRVSNISKEGIWDTDIYLDEEKYYIDELAPKKDTILFSKDGSIGIAYKVEEDMKAITSGALLHLKVVDESVFPDYLTLVLNSKVVKLQAERDAGGSIIQHWKPDEIKQVIIPILDRNIQERIVELVLESFELRRYGKILLDKAKRAVEIAIETNEEEAFKILKLE